MKKKLLFLFIEIVLRHGFDEKNGLELGSRSHCLSDSDAVSDAKKGVSLAITMLAKEWVGMPCLSEFRSKKFCLQFFGYRYH